MDRVLNDANFVRSEEDDPIQRIVSLANRVFSVLGRGHSEIVYHNALLVEFRRRSIQYESEKIIPVLYEGVQVGFKRADIVLAGVVLEIKSMVHHPRLMEIEQVSQYMKCLNIRYGIVLNFGLPHPKQRDAVDYVIVDRDGSLTRNTE